jgi:hypothetical protein
MNAAINAQSRQDFAQAIFDYCRDTSNNLPKNSPKDDEQIEAAFASGNVSWLYANAATMEATRYHFQKMLKECMEISRSILAPTGPIAEAFLWVKLEGAFDFVSLHRLATHLGILREAENGETLSDLHGVLFWPFVRSSIRQTAVLPLLQGR